MNGIGAQAQFFWKQIPSSKISKQKFYPNSIYLIISFFENARLILKKFCKMVYEKTLHSPIKTGAGFKKLL